jgi:hypothetical protein
MTTTDEEGITRGWPSGEARGGTQCLGDKAREEGECGATDKLEGGGLLAPPSSTAWCRPASDDASDRSTAASRAASRSLCRVLEMEEPGMVWSLWGQRRFSRHFGLLW